MAREESRLPKILFYLGLFLVALAVFDSATLLVGVGFALFALYHFTSRPPRDQR